MSKSGWLKVVGGPMFAGKTRQLMLDIDRESAIGRRTIILSPTVDTRASDELVCHTGERRAVCKLDHLVPFVRDSSFTTADVIGIDEAQFFESSDLYDFVMEAVETYKKTVIVAGLDTNFRREPFGGVIRLVAIADKVQKLSALCSLCKDGTPAMFTRRTGHSSNDIEIGGKDMYQAVCRRHYIQKDSGNVCVRCSIVIG